MARKKHKSRPPSSAKLRDQREFEAKRRGRRTNHRGKARFSN